MIIILLIGIGAAKFIYLDLPKKGNDDPSNKSSVASVSALETTALTPKKDDNEIKSELPGKEVHVTSDQPPTIESETQDKNIPPVDPNRVVEAKSNPEPVTKDLAEAPGTKEEKKPLSTKDLAEMLNISPSMEFITEGGNTRVEFSAKPSKIVPNDSFIRLKNGDYYLGTLTQDGIPDGMGIIIYQDNSIYEGTIENGAKDGFGKFTDAEGIVTIGKWQNDHYVDESKEISAKKKGAYKVALDDPYFYIGHWEKKPTYEESPKYEALWIDFSFNSNQELTLAISSRERNSGKLNTKDISHKDTLSWIKTKLKIVNDNVLSYSKNKYKFKRLSKRVVAPEEVTKKYSMFENSTSTKAKK